MDRFHRLISTATAIALSVTSFRPVSAQGFGTVYCTNCGTEWTALASKVVLVEQLINQGKQLENEVSQLANMVTNTKAIPNMIWGTATQDFNQLNSLLSQSKSLAYTAGNLDQQFASRYSTYPQYLSENMTASDWQSKYAEWSKEGTDNALYAYKGLGLQASQLKNEQAMMQQLQAMAGTAEGRMQALQIGNMMAAQNVQQLQELRQLMMMQLQMQADYVAMQQDKEAAHEANRTNLYTNWKYVPDTDGQVY